MEKKIETLLGIVIYIAVVAACVLIIIIPALIALPGFIAGIMPFDWSKATRNTIRKTTKPCTVIYNALMRLLIKHSFLTIVDETAE